MNDWNLYIFFGVVGSLFAFFSTCFCYYKRKDVMKRRGEKIYEAERDEVLAGVLSYNMHQNSIQYGNKNVNHFENQNTASGTEGNYSRESSLTPTGYSRENTIRIESDLNSEGTSYQNPQQRESVESETYIYHSRQNSSEMREEDVNLRMNEHQEDFNGVVNPAFDSSTRL